MSIEKINKKWKELEEQSNPIYIVSKAKLLAEEYAKYRLDQFISEHFPEEVSRETTTDTLPSKFKISINYEGKELSAEEKLIAKITKKLSEDLNKQRDEQIEFFKRLLRD
jgi:hypothetical protein